MLPRPVRRYLPALAATAATLLLGIAVSRSAEEKEPPLAHAVFFTLKDRSPEARERFIASCYQYLTRHEGALSFSLGTIAEDVEEPGVSVRDFDVAMHVVFASKAAEKNYLVSPRHTRFVEENKAGFAKVRVFDSYLTKPEQ